jgi:PAS domain S-box-containing protein
VELSAYSLDPLREDGEFILYRAHSNQLEPHSILLLAPSSARPTAATLGKIDHEYLLRSDLESAWALRPIESSLLNGKRVLLLEDPGGIPLSQLINGPMDIKQFLCLGIRISGAVAELHKRSLIHKDLKPANIFVAPELGRIWLTGFGIASGLVREQHSPDVPEFIAGTLAYMAPEQTGRMNRSIDSRSDLYSLGVTLYEMLTGGLPFTASDPMEWVHCHIARQPVPPSDRLREVPGSVSAIIMKLLAKTAETRYQTAAGVESDLQRCLTELETRGRIDQFELGEQDASDRLLIPEKLYGRESDVETLVVTFNRVAEGGPPELVLVSGYSGVGKSSVVNELHKFLVPPRGLFASGKFDQHKRDIPYSTLAQAFESLIRRLLAKPESELAAWGNAFRDALGPNAKLMVDLVPELKIIIGEQPTVPELPPQDAQRRFQLVFRRFICVFARPEHPLALFLDDLQWLDAATADLLEDLLTQSDVQYLLLIGAYRDSEVDAAHPLTRKLLKIRHAGAAVREIVLMSLSRGNLERLIADTFLCELERAIPLAQLVHEKTAGNPFFSIQFITALKEDRLIVFDYRERRWSWDLKRIHAQGYTDNVADLMVGKLSHLPAATQTALQMLACIGNSAKISLLRMICDRSHDVHGDLRDAVGDNLVFRSEDSYRFLHDRVQEAAYSLIPEETRSEAHLRVGRLLLAQTPPERREETIFEIVNQLNRGSALITSRNERDRLAELNLLAGKRAKASTAYTSALNYLIAGSGTLDENSWERRHELTFQLELHRAECEFLGGQLSTVEERLAELSTHATTTVELASVACLQMNVYTTLDQNDRAVAIGLDCLRRLGVELSPQPTQEEVQREYERVWSQVGRRQIEDLIDLPLMTNPDVLDVLTVLTEVLTPALFCDDKLSSLVICRMANLSLEHGNTDGSCFAYVWFAIIVGHRFGNYEAGFHFGQLGYNLVEKRGLKRFRARTYYAFGNVVLPWTRHIRAGRDLVRHAFDVASEIGDVASAAICCDQLMKNLLAAGDPLVDMQREGESGLQFVQRVGFGRIVDHIMPQLSLIRALRGLTPALGSLNGDQFDEVRFEHYLASNPALAEPECWYWVRKLQARVFAGDYASAVDAALNAQRRIVTSPSQFMVLDPLETAEYHLFGGLSRAGAWDSALPDQRQQHFDAVVAHHRQLQLCSENCPDNFESRAALLAAEIARMEGRVLDAEQLYEQAIRSAHANNFIHIEALANELAARFYEARGFEKIAYAYLRDARYSYLRWGADGKVRQLDKLYPQPIEQEPLFSSTRTIGTPVEQLDLATVIKVSQAVSGEIVEEKLIDTLMRTAIEHAGAERGLLIFPRSTELLLQAEATTAGGSIRIDLTERRVSSVEAPEGVLQYAARTLEAVILGDASNHSSFSDEEYIRRRHSRSVLCLPLVKQRKLVALLYLENSLAANVFTSRRVAVLNVLASAAAISLENGRLYRGLQEREAKIRRLVDANIVGIFIWDFEGRILEANDAFLRIVGYNRGDLASSSIQWTTLTPGEWQDRDDHALADLRTVGTTQSYEKEITRKDGSRVPVLVGSALFEAAGNEGVSFVIDLTEQKSAADALRRSERELRQVIETIPAMVWTALPDGSNALMNRRWIEYTGSSASGLGWQGAVHPDDLERHMEVFRTSSAKRLPFEDEVRFRGANGEYRWFLVQAVPFVDERGNILKWYGIVTDIEDRKRAEEALKRSEGYLAQAQSLAHIGSWAFEVEGSKLFYLSDEWYRIYGLDPKAGIPSWEQRLQRVHPDDRTKFQATIDRAIAEKSDFDVEFRILPPDSPGKYIHSVGHPILGSYGELEQFVGVSMDITESKQAEEAFRLVVVGTAGTTGTDFFHSLVQHMAQALGARYAFVTTCDDQKHARTLAVWKGDGFGENFEFDIADTPCESVLHGEICHYRQGLQGLFPLDKILGDWQAESYLGLPMLDHSNRVIGHIAILDDKPMEADLRAIDLLRIFASRAAAELKRQKAEDDLHAALQERERLRRVQAELAHINRASTLGELTASLAHEIKQPIGAAVTNAEACVRLLAAHQPDIPEAREAALEMVKDARRTADIIDRVRSLYQKGSSELDTVDVNEVIREMVVMLANEANRHSVTISTDLTAGLPHVMADRVQLQQLLMNLMLNGIEAMGDAGGNLRIKSQLAEDHLLISVADTGVGLPTQDTDKMFDAFFTTKPQGTGLGLAISRSIINSHGGRIWATANSERGATFHVALPHILSVAA